MSLRDAENEDAALALLDRGAALGDAGMEFFQRAVAGGWTRLLARPGALAAMPARAVLAVRDAAMLDLLLGARDVRVQSLLSAPVDAQPYDPIGSTRTLLEVLAAGAEPALTEQLLRGLSAGSRGALYETTYRYEETTWRRPLSALAERVARTYGQADSSRAPQPAALAHILRWIPEPKRREGPTIMHAPLPAPRIEEAVGHLLSARHPWAAEALEAMLAAVPRLPVLPGPLLREVNSLSARQVLAVLRAPSSQRWLDHEDCKEALLEAFESVPALAADPEVMREARGWWRRRRWAVMGWAASPSSSLGRLPARAVRCVCGYL